MSPIGRREFLKNVMRGTLGAAVAAPYALARPLDQDRKIRDGMAYRRLGRTGLWVSEISLGGSPVPDWAIFRQIIERGVNYIDTSHSYMNGNSERQIGRLLKEVGRDTVHVGTKFHLRRNWSKASIIASVEGSLKRLQTDYLDVLLIHGAQDPKSLTDDRVLNAFEVLKKQGKFRFNGLSCHANHQDVIPEAVRCGHYDMVQMGYNIFDIQQGEEDIETYEDYLGASGTRRLIRLAKSRDVGVIAMKTLKVGGRRQNLSAYRTGNTTLFQAMLKWALDNPDISSVVIEMLSFQEMEEDLAVVGKPLTEAERKTLFRYVAENGKDYCHMCGTCARECPAGIPTTSILRYLAYHESYGKTLAAQTAYARVPRQRTAASCRSCVRCEAVCPYGVSVRGQIRRAHALLG